MHKRVHFIDFETHCFGPHNMAPRIVCMSRQSEGDTDASIELWDVARDRLKSMLLQSIRGESVIAGHSISYDMMCALSNDTELSQLVWAAYAADGIECTLVREKLIDICKGPLSKKRGGYSLAGLCDRHFDIELDKDPDGWRLRYEELDGVPVDQWPARAREYSLDDARWGLRLYLMQREGGYPIPTQHFDARASLALRLTGAWGVVTDIPRAKSLRASIHEQMHALRGQLLDAGLMSLSSGVARKSDVSIRASVERSWPEDLGQVPRTDKGNIKKDKYTLELCEDAALQALIKYNTLEKQGSTYVETLLQDVIHAYFNELVNSGRTSCQKPNLQNQPRLPGIRECFIARPGRVLVSCDFDSQEMRMLAQAQLLITGSSRLATRYREDVAYDPHQHFADETGGERQHTKIANFGIPGGMGAKGLVKYAKGYNKTWTVAFAKSIKDKYFQFQPEMRDFFRYVSHVVGPASCGDLTIPQSGMVCGSVGYCDAANRLFQTPAAHASKDALFQVVRRCFDASMNSPLLASRPWNFCHDEVIIESPEYAVDEVLPEIERVMVGGMQPWCPDVPCSASSVAMRRWSKKAQHTRNDQGNIIPWDE